MSLPNMMIDTDRITYYGPIIAIEPVVHIPPVSVEQDNINWTFIEALRSKAAEMFNELLNLNKHESCAALDAVRGEYEHVRTMWYMIHAPI